MYEPKTVLTVTEVNQNFSKAKQAVEIGPVAITERGTKSLILMRYAEFEKMRKQMGPLPFPTKGESAWDLFQRLHVPGIEDIDLELPPREIQPARDIDLS